MQRLIKFKLSRECREIAVNPAKVLYVCHYETGASALHFTKDCFVRVQGELDEVVRKLEGALCEAAEPTMASPRAQPSAANVN